MGIGQELSVVDVAKFYGTFQALTDINLICKPGEFVSILGSSGSGKTTLLKVIAGFERCSSGKIFLNGKDVATIPCYKRNIGMLFQNYALFPHLTVAQNIAYPLKLRKMNKSDIDARVKEMISMIKLNGLEDRYPRQLSGGQQQRVALARAIVYNPPLLLLDEPLGALDKNLRHDMQFEIKRITHELGMTTISVTHDQEEAFSMSDKICIVSGGKIQQFDTPERIYEKPANRFVAEFMGTTNIIPIKDVVYETNEKRTKITGFSSLTQGKCTLEVDTACAKEKLKDPFFALRPEAIHLFNESSTTENVFEAEITESIYLGQYVKCKAKVADLSLNVTLNVQEFRDLASKKAVKFAFEPSNTAILYS